MAQSNLARCGPVALVGRGCVDRPFGRAERAWCPYRTGHLGAERADDYGLSDLSLVGLPVRAQDGCNGLTKAQHSPAPNPDGQRDGRHRECDGQKSPDRCIDPAEPGQQRQASATADQSIAGDI